MVDLFTTRRQFLRIDEVTEILEVSRRSVYLWIATGKIEYIRIGNGYRISVAGLRRRIVEPRNDRSLFKRAKSVQSATQSA